MSGVAAAFLIVAIVLVGRMAERRGFNFFTFTIGWGAIILAGLTLTGYMP